MILHHVGELDAETGVMMTDSPGCPIGDVGPESGSVNRARHLQGQKNLGDTRPEAYKHSLTTDQTFDLPSVVYLSERCMVCSID